MGRAAHFLFPCDILVLRTPHRRLHRSLELMGTLCDTQSSRIIEPYTIHTA